MYLRALFNYVQGNPTQLGMGLKVQPEEAEKAFTQIELQLNRDSSSRETEVLPIPRA